MIRFAWRQARAETMLAVAGLAAAAVVAAATGPHLAHLYDSTIIGCRSGGDCAAAARALLTNDHGLRIRFELAANHGFVRTPSHLFTNP